MASDLIESAIRKRSKTRCRIGPGDRVSLRRVVGGGQSRNTWGQQVRHPKKDFCHVFRMGAMAGWRRAACLVSKARGEIGSILEIPIYTRALSVAEKSVGSEHPEVSTAWYSLRREGGFLQAVDDALLEGDLADVGQRIRRERALRCLVDQGARVRVQRVMRVG